MAAKKKPSNVVYVKGNLTKEHAKLIAHRLSTAEVKTATPSRSQGKIQARVAWTDPDGAHGLGYLSMDVRDAESVAAGKGTGPSLNNFFQDVFRVVQWCKKTSRKEMGTDADWGAYEQDLRAELNKLGVFRSDSKVHALHKDTIAAIRDCAAAGEHKTARKTRMIKRVKDAISGNIQFAISQGLSDDEIRELVELAFVKHTMEC